MGGENDQHAEDAREDAEAGRREAEIDREGAEREDADSRQAAEQGRAAAEGKRARAETKRRVRSIAPQTARGAWIAAIALLIAGLVPAVAASLIVTAGEVDRAEETTRHLFTEVCLQNNLAKAGVVVTARALLRQKGENGDPQKIRVADRALERAASLNVIIDCERTFRGGGGGVPLTYRVNERYLKLIGQGWVPELEGDVIVGKHRAETEGHRDF